MTYVNLGTSIQWNYPFTKTSDYDEKGSNYDNY